MARNTPAADVDSALTALRQNLQSLPAGELAAVLNHLRAEQTDKVLDSFDEMWHQLETLSEEHRALTGTGFNPPLSIEDVFESSPVSNGSGRARPDAWYTHEITSVIRFAGEAGASEQFISDFVAARGGDARYATRTLLPNLVENGFIEQSEDGAWHLANHRSDAWYDYAVMSFINGHEGEELPSTKTIHDHVIELGGHGAETVSKVLPRLEAAGRIAEIGHGYWDVANRKPEAWYDYTITHFVAAAGESNLPTTKTIHDYVISQGGHGAIAVSDALPRLAETGHLTEVGAGFWKLTRHRPTAWYDYTILALFNQDENAEPLSTKEIHDHVIAQGGHGAEVPTKALPRLVELGKLTDLGDGRWDLASRKPRAWYDHVVMSTIRGADEHALPTLKSLHDLVISQGGHGAMIPTEVIPSLIEAGEIIEVETGIYDLAARHSDAWYDQTVLAFIESNDGSASTMQLFEHIIALGGHGGEIAPIVMPRLAYAGLVTEKEPGLWAIASGVPSAYLQSQIFNLIRDHSPNSASFDDCCGLFDEDLAEADTVAAAIASLEEAKLVERSGEDDAWRLPGTNTRRSAKPQPTRRRSARKSA